jgi:hypothetical protein
MDAKVSAVTMPRMTAHDSGRVPFKTHRDAAP